MGLPENLHPTAIVHPKAQIDSTAVVGPYAVIDEKVIIGAHTTVGPHVYLTGDTVIGRHNRIHAGCVLGDAPQDVRYDGAPTRLRIGDHNVFREHVTAHRSNKLEEETVIGSNNLFMAHSHVGHNARVGNQIIVANGALLAGHAIIEDRAFISGNCLVHQFVRVGTLALMQGGSGVSKDLPPYTIVWGNNAICGLNTVGLRRAGFSPVKRLELKRLYHALFRSKENWPEAFEKARREFSSAEARVLLDFIASSQRGICREIRSGRRLEGREAEDDG